MSAGSEVDDFLRKLKDPLKPALAAVRFKDLASVRANKAALTKVLRAWIRFVK